VNLGESQQFSFWQYKGRPQRTTPTKYLKELRINREFWICSEGLCAFPVKNISKKPKLKLLRGFLDFDGE